MQSKRSIKNKKRQAKLKKLTPKQIDKKNLDKRESVNRGIDKIFMATGTVTPITENMKKAKEEKEPIAKELEQVLDNLKNLEDLKSGN